VAPGGLTLVREYVDERQMGWAMLKPNSKSERESLEQDVPNDFSILLGN
jgi:hypothetical protein